jgi:tRNA threonylcarbamoyladenosine biosynthesis protein TsaE
MDSNLVSLTYTLDNIDDAVKQFWEAASGHCILAFSGEMGAGKTTFIHHLCDYLGVEDAVSSPTFALINEYHFADPNGKDNIIFHLDWYRLNSTEEAVQAGLEDCIDQAKKGNAYCFIEWPEKAIELLQPPYLWISIESIDPFQRLMSVTLVNGQDKFPPGIQP